MSLRGETYSVTIPAGGLSGTGTVTVTAYAPGAGPHGIAAQKRAASGSRTSQSTRSTQTYTAGTDTLVADLVVNVSGATVTAPFTISVSGAAAPASGSNVYVQGFNNGNFDDIDTAGYASGTYTTAPASTSPTFPGPTLASNTEYVFYTHAGTITGDGTVTVNAPSTAVPTGNQVTITASETTANGFPYLGRAFTYSLDNPDAGSIDPNTGVFTSGPKGGTANVTATETLSHRAASAKITSSSSRPGSAGISAAYTGSIVEVDQNNVIATPAPGGTKPPVSTTITSQLATSVSTATDANGNTVFTSTENANQGVRTVTTTTNATVAYEPHGSSTYVRALKTVAQDSFGSTYETDYGAAGDGRNNGVQTVLPETSWSAPNNTAQLTYIETDPGQNVSGGTSNANINRTQAPDGSFTQTSVTHNGKDGTSTVTNTAQGNPDLSGFITILDVGGGYKFSAPAAGKITYGFYAVASPGSTQLGNTPSFTQQFANWIPASNPQPYVETDSITPNSSYDASCVVPAGYASTATLVRQQSVYADTALGTLETRTVSSYDVPGAGTVCTVVSDVTQRYYDYTLQVSPTLLRVPGATPPPTPYETISISETLSLTSTNAPGASSAARSSQSVRAGGLILPRALALSRVQHLVRLNALKREAASFVQGGSK